MGESEIVTSLEVLIQQRLPMAMYMANFRPVSNLSFMSKVVERAVANPELIRAPVRQQPASLLPVSLSQEALN